MSKTKIATMAGVAKMESFEDNLEAPPIATVVEYEKPVKDAKPILLDKPVKGKVAVRKAEVVRKPLMGIVPAVQPKEKKKSIKITQEKIDELRAMGVKTIDRPADKLEIPLEVRELCEEYHLRPCWVNKKNYHHKRSLGYRKPWEVRPDISSDAKDSCEKTEAYNGFDPELKEWCEIKEEMILMVTPEEDYEKKVMYPSLIQDFNQCKGMTNPHSDSMTADFDE